MLNKNTLKDGIGKITEILDIRNIIGILKDAFIFPSKNVERFAFYLLLSVLMVVFAFGGVLTYNLGLFGVENYLIGGIYLLISMIIGFLVFGYHIKVIESGIKLEDELPAFKLLESFMTGFENIAVSIVYFIVPTFISLIVVTGTDIFGKVLNILREFILQTLNVYILGKSMDLAVNAISNSIYDLVVSLAIIIATVLIAFFVFSLFQAMAKARLANTDSLKEALNISEAVGDLISVGVVKVILLVLLMIIIIAIIGIILLTVFSSSMLLLTVLLIIITPYLALVSQSAIGLLYSDIA